MKKYFKVFQRDPRRFISDTESQLARTLLHNPFFYAFSCGFGINSYNWLCWYWKSCWCRSHQNYHWFRNSSHVEIITCIYLLWTITWDLLLSLFQQRAFRCMSAMAAFRKPMKKLSATPARSSGPVTRGTKSSTTSSDGASAPGFFSSIGAALSSGVSKLFYGETKCNNQ